jgi:hypothetical protein
MGRTSMTFSCAPTGASGVISSGFTLGPPASSSCEKSDKKLRFAMVLSPLLGGRFVSSPSYITLAKKPSGRSSGAPALSQLAVTR